MQMDADKNVAAAICDLLTITATFDTQYIMSPTYIPSAAAEEFAIDAVVTNFVQIRSEEGITLTEEQIQAYREDLVVSENASLLIYDPAIVGNAGDIVVAYKVSVAALSNPQEKYSVLISAVSGNTLLVYPLVHSALDRAIYDQQNDANLSPVLVREEGEGECQIEDADWAYNYLGDVYDIFTTRVLKEIALTTTE